MNLDTYTSSAPGIVQLDVLVATALMEGMKRLRASEIDLEWCFSYLAHDDLTSEFYGRKEIDNAKAWIKKQDFPVKVNPGINDIEFPCFSVEMMDGKEQASTFSDLNYEPAKDIDLGNLPVAGPFTPTNVSATGILTFPTFGGATIVPGMTIFTKTGAKIPITKVSGLNLTIPTTSLTNDFGNCYIKLAGPAHRVALGSVVMKETVRIGMHVQGEPTHAMYLFSALFYILMRYKKDLLEARGLEETTISYGQMSLGTYDKATQPVFERQFTVTGLVTQYWTTGHAQKILAVRTQPSVGPDATGANPYEVAWEGQPDPNINSEGIDPEFGANDPDLIIYRIP